jgi:crotonobetainyl-CoA:carnitine CoA-transferase CaiB-like acyl-CoA transferase
MAPTSPPLKGWVIVDLSTGIAGAYCTKLLADGGAEVIKVESPEGDPLRAWSASGATIREGDDGALFQFLGTSKRSVVADPAEESDLDGVRDLLRDADAVVWSPESRLAKIERFAPEALLEDHSHLIVTSITPFGLDGPWRDRPATEFTLQAWSGGMIGLGRGDPDRAPVFVGGQVGAWLAGAFAAAGTMLSRLMSGGSGAGEIIDVSMLEALVMCLTYYPVTYVDAMGRPFRTGRSVITPGVGLAKDGMVAVGVGTGQHWLDFCVMVGHPEWMEDKSLFRERGRLAPEIDQWFASHTVDEIRDLATAFRLPNAPIANGANLPGMDQFEARRSFVSNPGGGFLQPEQPYRMHPARLRPPQPAPTLGADTGHRPGGDRSTRSDPAAGLPLSGLRVLDMTAFWAGPSCTHVLAMLGAEVIHLESTGRLDGTRMLGPSFKVDQWWERSPIFSGLNTNKKSLTLDFQSERGMQLLRSLIATTDVIVENYTPRVLDQVGLTFDALRSLRDDIVLIRMPGFGLDGPWRDNAAFAYTIEDASGLTWMTGHPDQKPLEPYCIGDPNAGIHALVGLLLALEHRRRTGEAVAVEAAMIDAAINLTAEQVVEYSAYGSLLERAGNRGPTAAPQNLYRTADTDEHGGRDCWVAIAVETEKQWDAMIHALGRPDWATGASLSTGPGRAEYHDLIDDHLSIWCGERRADEIVDLLWPAGVPVAKVMQPHQQGDLPQLQARGFFEVVDHPISGTARHSTLPMRFSLRDEPVHRRHAPLLGEHNVELLGELGLTEADIAELEIEGVIGRTPVGANPTGARPTTGSDAASH